jgi:hypothetical protein
MNPGECSATPDAVRLTFSAWEPALNASQRTPPGACSSARPLKFFVEQRQIFSAQPPVECWQSFLNSK